MESGPKPEESVALSNKGEPKAPCDIYSRKTGSDPSAPRVIPKNPIRDAN